MSKNARVELSLEELEAVHGGGFWYDVWEFSKGLWKKTTKDVVIRLKNWG